jgi:hypothetical protein
MLNRVENVVVMPGGDDEHQVAREPVTWADWPKDLITLPVSKLSQKGALAPAEWRPAVRHDATELRRDHAGGITGLERSVRHEKDRVRLAAVLIRGRSPGRTVRSMGAA